jgi:hypothetical protein
MAQRPLPKLDFDVLLYDADTPWNMDIREMFSRLTGGRKAGATVDGLPLTWWG